MNNLVFNMQTPGYSLICIILLASGYLSVSLLFERDKSDSSECGYGGGGITFQMKRYGL